MNPTATADRQGKELEEQRKIAKLRSLQETFNYEKSITAEFLVSSVESRRRMASPGFPVAIAPRQSASRVMESISSVYLAKPRKSGRLRCDEKIFSKLSISVHAAACGRAAAQAFLIACFYPSARCA